VMAIGDSMTAAFAAEDHDILTAILEYRTDSWAIGANETAVTVYNLIEHFNKKAVGGSVKNTLPFDVLKMKDNKFWEVNFKSSVLNAAVSEAELHNIGEQIEYLGNMTREHYPAEFEGWVGFHIPIRPSTNSICCRNC